MLLIVYCPLFEIYIVFFSVCCFAWATGYCFPPCFDACFLSERKKKNDSVKISKYIIYVYRYDTSIKQTTSGFGSSER